MRTQLLKYAILAGFAIFLLYPIAYVVPRALLERTEPYEVHLVDAGAQPQDVANLLMNRLGMEPPAALLAVQRLPSLVAAELSLTEAIALNQSIRKEAGGTARIDGRLRPTLFYVEQVFASPFLWECFAASLIVAVCSTLITTVVTLPLAVWLTRFRFPGRDLLSALILVPLILPPFVGSIGFRQIFSRFGSLNLWLLNAGIIHSPIDWLGSGLWGLIAMEVLHLYPIMYLNVAAALANVDPTLEEAARNLGSSEWTLFRRVTFPLVLPGYFAGAAIVFVWAFTDLGTPVVFGYRRVVAYQIFEKLSEAESNPLGHGLVLVTLLLTAGLYTLARRFATRGGQFAMVSKGGVGSTARPAGRARTTIILAYGGVLTALAVLPHVAVVLTSVAREWSFTPLPTKYTTDYFVLAMTHKLAGMSIRNSLVYSLVSTLFDIFFGVTIAYLVARRPSWLSRALDGLSMLPLALPGLVLAFGYLTCYHAPAEWLLQASKSMEGVWLSPLSHVLAWLSANLEPQKSPFLLLVIAYAMRRLPYMSRTALAGFQQTPIAFEEAAENLGATRWRIMRQITLPLIAANIVAGSILTFSFAVLEVSDSLMLAQRENFFPVTKAIYVLLARPDDGPYIASAMGVLGMILLASALLVATAVLGRRMGELFRT